MCTEVRRPILVAAIGTPCPYCGEVMDTGQRAPSRDHIRSYKRGGRLADPNNRVIVCQRCNSDKGHLSLEAFRNRLARAGDPRAVHVEAFMRELNDRPAS